MSVGDFFDLKKGTKKEIEEVIQAGGFKSDLLSKKIGTLSSGQFQKILVLWSLIGNPSVLLFDEPTTGIDVGGEETIYQFLDQLKKERGLTILLVTHDLNIVSKYSNYVICLNKKVICLGAPHEILTPENLQNLYKTNIKFYHHHHE